MDSPGFDGSDTIDFWDLFNKQDFGVCELAHLGNRSRAHKQGVLGPAEPHVLRFNQWVRDKLGWRIAVASKRENHRAVGLSSRPILFGS